MQLWRPQRFRSEALAEKRDPAVVDNALDTASILRTKRPNLPPVFTLKHLAVLADVKYSELRAIVARNDVDPYRTFRIRKRPAFVGDVRYRVIAVPRPGLLKAQRWITQAILANVQPHAASVAFSKGDQLIEAAKPHCGCRWLIKLDICNFFESINEVAVYRVFRSLGYQALIAFEMARLCTRLGGPSRRSSGVRWNTNFSNWPTIQAYAVYRPDGGPTVGHLPQGAPSSPMLGNLAMQKFDEIVCEIARDHGLTYTRYADDLTLSTARRDFTRGEATGVIRKVFAVMRGVGLSPNDAKTRVTSPGARKVVLGLLVDTDRPRLSREFKASMRRHIHYLTKDDANGLTHIQARGFSSVVGFRNHLSGLLSFAKQIEPDYAQGCVSALAKVAWPI